MRNSLYILILLFAVTSCKKDDPEPVVTSSGPMHPVSFTIESVVMTGFNALDNFGDYWDSSTNSPDPFIEIFKSGAIVYSSVSVGGADNETSYPMNTSATGSMPILFSEGESMRLRVWEYDSAPDIQYMDQLFMDDAYNFFYTGDQAESFTDVFVSTDVSDINFLISGTFEY